jgi:hypothetical protein
MPRVAKPPAKRLIAVIVVTALLFGFSPISRMLLRLVDGSFAPSPYTSLALRNPSLAVTGVKRGTAILVVLSNHTGRTVTYHWRATQADTLIRSGKRTVLNNRVSTLRVSTKLATPGRLRVSLRGTTVYVEVPISRS